MEQVTQKLRNGRIQVLQVPQPPIAKNQILVHNWYSCISAGTESSTVNAARKSYIGKAKERPAQARQVLEKLRAQGPWQTYLDVMKKLDAHSPLGYSSAGMVMEVGKDIQDVKVGDFVACGGSTACHAEWISVPHNLYVPLEREADLKQASYNTIGAIALQGVRQLDPKLGETVAVIGLGLLGQLTCLLLRASGVRVVGVDVSRDAVDSAEKHCTDMALRRTEPGAEERIWDFSGARGCDGVIITAASSSLDPINFAGTISRKKGTIVVVGAVPTGFDREPHFYQKELNVKMSCSYGPGRYDPSYEEKGMDYPIGYVRWTERRNMEAFQKLITMGRIDLGYLTTHIFPLQDVTKAYDLILNKSERYLGILLKYPVIESQSVPQRVVRLKTTTRPWTEMIQIGFIGAGSYAQGHLLPHLVKKNDIALTGVATTTPTSARSVADRFGFAFCTCHAKDILQSSRVNTVFIATRHDSHGEYVLESLKSGKHVFVEKPLCLTETKLGEIEAALQQADSHTTSPMLMVGYNRRFASLAKKLKHFLNPEPMSMIYRVNAGAIDADSWIQDPDIGGGRVLGEVCHFVDFLTFLSGSTPSVVSAFSMKSQACLEDTLTITLQFVNGSIGTIHYFANGSSKISKEYIEVYQSGQTMILDDFRRLTFADKRSSQTYKLRLQDKGQKEEIAQYLEALKKGLDHVIPFHELFSTSRVCFEIQKCLKNNIPRYL